MKKIQSLALAALLIASPTAAPAQSTPNFITGQVPTAAQWNSYFRAKQDVLNYVPLNIAGGFMTGKLTLGASTTTGASLNFPVGVAPSLPNNGDMWFTAAGLFLRAGGVTVGPLSSPTAGSFTATQPLAVTFPGTSSTNYALNFNSTLTAAGGNLGVNLATVNSWTGAQTFGGGATVTGSFTATGLVKNADLVSATTTVNGQACTLGASCTIIASAGTITVGTTTVTNGPGTLYNTTSGGPLSAASFVNNGVFVTNGSGVPSWSQTLPNGLALGTPASATLTNATGLPIATGVANLGTGVATFLTTPSSANLLAALTTKTGTGTAVFDTSPTITTPVLSGTVTGTYTLGGTPSISGAAVNSGLVGGTYGGTGVNNGARTITVGGNFSASSTVSITGAFSTAGAFTQAGAFATTLTSTATTNATLPAGTQTLAALGAAQTWTGVQSFSSGGLRALGSTSGGLTITCAAVCGTNTLTFPAGTTDFSGTGGAGQFVKQATLGGAFTVVQPAFADLTGAATNAQLANMNAGTLKANNTAGPAAPTDVTGAAARLPALLNIDQLTTIGNADLTISSTTRTVATTTTLTATRTYTLPAANSLNPGQTLTILDQAGAVNGANIILVNRVGSDTVNGTNSAAITTQYGGMVLTSDGVSKWTVQSSGSGGGGGGGVSSVGTDSTMVGGPIVTSGTLGVNPTTVRGYKSGLTLSTSGPSSTFGVAIGTATDSGDTVVMQLNSALSKTTAAWAVGAGGSLDTGTIANSTWYHVFLMMRPDTGVVDSCISITVSGCTTGGNIPAAYTKFRRIGSMLTNGSGQWTPFVQNGNEFTWVTPIASILSFSASTTPTAITLAGTPTGVKAVVRLTAGMLNSQSTFALLYSLDSTATATNSPVGNYNMVGGNNVAQSPYTQYRLRTNTSSQIGVVASGTPTTIQGATTGYDDDFGAPAGAGTAATAPSANVLQNYISGYTLSTAGSSTSFGVTTGSATDASNATFIVLQNSMTKTTGAWVAGSGNGSLDTGTIAANTWYHAFAIQRADTSAVDVCVTTNVAGCATGGNIPSAYGYQRRIGSMLTNASSQWTGFVQNGSTFMLSSPAATAANNIAISNTTANLLTVTAPPGVSTEALISAYYSNPTAHIVYISSPLVSDDAAGGTTWSVQGASGGQTGATSNRVLTNTSSQIRYRSQGTGGNFTINTLGWVDNRNGPSLSGGGIATSVTVNGTKLQGGQSGNFLSSNSAGNISQVALRSYLSGLTLSTPGASNNFSVATGTAADSTNVVMMTLGSSFTKFNTAWSLGNSGGSLDTASISATTWYHVFLMQRLDTNVVDVCLSTTVSGCATGGSSNIPTAYTVFRRIGSMRTDGSGNFLKFNQVGDQVFYGAPFGDATNINTTTTPTAYALTVPPGVSVQATVRILAGNTANGSTWVFYSPSEGAQAANNPPGNETHYTTGASTYFANQLYITTDSNRQIMGVSQSSVSNQVWIVTTGYVDKRGRDN